MLKTREPSARYPAVIEPTLLPQFDLLATARGGVSGLRRLIFELAAAGRLVFTEETTDTVPLDAVAEFIMGQAPPGADCNGSGVGTIFVKTGEFGLLYPEVREWTTKPLKLARTGDVLICVVGATIGKLNLAIDCAIGRSVAAIRPNARLDTKYLYFALMPFTLSLRSGARGSAQGVIGKTDLAAVQIRVPKLREQKAIVAKVDELMLLCDALEAKGRLESERHARLLGTLLGTLTDSSTPEELAANWQRVADHFDLLLDRPEAVDALEQAILQLAVRGLLVPQDLNDDPAFDLVRRIRSHREEQVKAGFAKREKPSAPLSETDLPFELPTGWEWVRFNELIEPAKPISYGVLVPGPEVSGGVPFVRIADLSLTDPPAQPEKSISIEVDAKYQRTRLEGGEILMGVVGSIGKLGVAPLSWVGANIARAICRIVPVSLVNKDFVLLLLQSEFMRASFAGDTRTLAQPTLNVGLIRGSATPLPPIAEQNRIVARVNELRCLCADLRHRLERGNATQTALAEALIDQALAA